MKRIVLHTKDVMIITGKSERYSRELIRKMKEHFLKEKHQYITIKEFSDYLGLNSEEVEKTIH
jgi:ABC-type metal ion transport system substrate-binding protein